MKEKTLIQQFRDIVYQSFEKRGDAALDMLDALTSAAVVESPVALSESPLFRRAFGSIYDVLTEGGFQEERLRTAWYAHQPEDGETLAGYEVYGIDATPRPYAEAPTLPEGQFLKAHAHAAPQIGHKYSRLVQWGTSWIAPQHIARISHTSTDSETGVEQVLALDQQSVHPKVVVGDSLYANRVFLAIFLVVKTVVRLRGNRVLYEAPHQRGRSRKHGPKFKLSSPSRAPDHEVCFRLGWQRVHAQPWYGLHFYAVECPAPRVLAS